MKTKIYTLNQMGLSILRKWIEDTRGHDDAGPLCLLDDRALNAWAEDAEFSMNNHGAAVIEMHWNQTRSRLDELLFLRVECFDVVECEDE
jgi:hypothetical protein